MVIVIIFNNIMTGNITKILSFDVGIKNLAFCLMEKKDDDLTIKKWNIINLVEDRDLCQFKLRNGKLSSSTVSRPVTLPNIL